MTALMDVTSEFSISGELKSYLNLMPNSDHYELKYTLVPQHIGRWSLPKLNILERSS